jgi:hypothetical protein
MMTLVGFLLAFFGPNARPRDTRARALARPLTLAPAPARSGSHACSRRALARGRVRSNMFFARIFARLLDY